MVYLLSNKLQFPDPRHGEDDGLIAIGGDLSVERLLLAYSNGIFPWYDFRRSDMPFWYCPLDRFVIFPDEIHISHSMRTLMNSGRYMVTFGKDFHGVITNCSRLRYDMEGAWLGEDMIEAFEELHRQGYASSVEVWEPSSTEGQEARLVGGLYGVTLGRGFFGESMFSLVPSASKLALITLAQSLQGTECAFIDCQLETAHLKTMGGRYISYERYMKLLKK